MIMLSHKSDFVDNHSNFIRKRNFNHSNIQRFREDLNAIDWSSVTSCDNSDQAFNLFVDDFNNKLDKNIPLKTVKVAFKSKSNQTAPWISQLLFKSINTKNKLYRQYIAKPTSTRKLKYTKYKNILISLLRNSKKQYYIRQFEQEKNNIHNTWKVINSVLNNKLSCRSINNIMHEGKLINNFNQIATCFNDYFVNLGPNLAKCIPRTQTTFSDYLEDPNPRSIFFEPVNEQEVVNIVNNLHNKTSSGHDLINVSLVKNSISVISKPIAHNY